MIRDQFAFLADYGFAVDCVTQDTFLWRKGDRTIQLSRDWRDGTLDLRFASGTGPSDRKAFGLHQALQVVDPETWPAHRWQGLRQSMTRKYIAEIADLLCAHLAAFLGNGAELWQQAADLASDRARAWTTGIVAEQVRRQADAGWKARDWSAVVARYAELVALGVPLKGSEVKRRQYARQHC